MKYSVGHSDIIVAHLRSSVSRREHMRRYKDTTKPRAVCEILVRDLGSQGIRGHDPQLDITQTFQTATS